MIRGAARVCPRTLGAPIAALLMFACALAGTPALGALPRPVIRAFSQAQVPLASVGIVVQAADAERPLFAHRGDVPMNPASVIKLVTSFAALELLGADYRWRTEAYLDGPLDRGVLRGDLVLKGHGDPKITIEQWQAFMQALRARGLDAVEGDLVLDRSFFAPGDHDPAGFDNEPLRPYNVGADALLVNFKAVKFRFAPDAGGRGVDVGVEPPLSQIAVGPPPAAASGSCGDWRARLGASFANPGPTAQASFAGTYPVSCGERDWWVALLDHPTYIHGMFESYFRAAGGRFDGRWRDGRAPANATPFVVLESMPLFLSLAASHAPPPATTAKATAAVTAWLERRRLRMPELVLDNGSGLSRQERISAGSLARLLRAAAASQVRDDFASSLAVAATDGTLQRRFVDGRVAGQGLLKTGTLDGVRAIAGYVIDSRDRRWIVVALVNHVNAARAQGAIDTLVQWVYTEAALWSPTQQR